MVGVLLLSNLASAQAPAEGTPPQPLEAPAAGVEPSAAPTEANKQKAKEHFEKGSALFNQSAWAPALAEFARSRELFPTRQATRAIAVTLKKLLRYDEALDVYEDLIRSFSSLPADVKTVAQKEIAELRALVGTIDISGAEPGSTIVIGGQSRGEYPPVSPLRVSAGDHLVRIVKEGFNPFEDRVKVAGGETKLLAVKQKALTSSGRLKVTEQSGRVIDVLVDGGVVGTAPWEGSVAVGKHAVLLRDGQGKLGTMPVSAKVEAQQITVLNLRAEALESGLHIVPTPADADVAIDSISVGHGAWSGWVRAGKHRIEIRADGFVGQEKTVDIQPGGRAVVSPVLDRDDDAARWRKPSRFVFDASVGLAVIPSFGGIDTTCQGECSSGIGVGPIGMFHASYELGNGVGFGLAGGYLLAGKNMSSRDLTFQPNTDKTQAPQQATANDALRLSSFMGGAAVSFRLGEDIPILFRVGMGALVGQIRDERTKGKLVQTVGVDAYPMRDASSLVLAIYGYVAPEVRVGYRFKKHFVVSGGVQALVLVSPSKPTWDNKHDLPAGVHGFGHYPSEELMGTFVLALAPSASFRYDF
jgi:hypothetical protein